MLKGKCSHNMAEIKVTTHPCFIRLRVLLGNVIWLKDVDDITVDNLEITGYVWNDPAGTSITDGFCVYLSKTANVLVQNVYAHDWVVKTDQDGKFGGIGGNDNTNSTARNCLVVAPTTVEAQYVTDTGGGRTSGAGVIGIQTIEGCEFVGTTQGIWGGRTVRNNIVRNGQDSFNSATHENGVWLMNNVDFYNNIIYNSTEGVGAYFLPAWGQKDGRINVFNNIFFRTPQINLTPQDNPSNTTAQIWFFNNLVHQGSYCIQVGTTKGGEAFQTLVIQNNIFISNVKYTQPSVVINIIDRNDLGSNYTNSNNVIYNATEAADLGLLQANFYKPANAIADLVDKGVSWESIMAFDMQGVARPQGQRWDIGPYEYVTNSNNIGTDDEASSLMSAGSLLFPATSLLISALLCVVG
jgi:hypothetical protein